MASEQDKDKKVKKAKKGTVTTRIIPPRTIPKKSN